jgi:acetyl esterase/lipase
MSRPTTLLALACTLAACSDSTTPDPVLFQDELFGHTVDQDIVYGTGEVNSPAPGTKDLHLDVYQPAGDDAPALRPGIVLIHGGSFMVGTENNPAMVQLGTGFAARGYVAASIEYRLTGDDPPTHAISLDTTLLLRTVAAAQVDAALAVDWLRDNAATYGVDPTRVAVGGYSAGAITSLGIAYWDPGILHADVDAVLSLSGGLYSWVGEIDAGEPPLIFIHGTADYVVAYSEAEALQERADSVGLTYEFYPLAGVGHNTPAQLQNEVDGVVLMERIARFMYEQLDLAGLASP